MVKYEEIAETPNLIASGVRKLREGMKTTFGTESTVHVYHSESSKSRALKPHTDPYDVVVIQVKGSKKWTTCVPTVNSLLSQIESKNLILHSYSEAELGQLQEILKAQQEGCSGYDDDDLSSMTCSTFTLLPGDTAYIPKGLIHFAIPGSDGSSHITISLDREGLSWADGFLYNIQNSMVSDAHNDVKESWIIALRHVIASDRGLPYLEIMPTWQIDSGYLCQSINQSAKFNNFRSQVDIINDFQRHYVSLCHELLPDVKRAFTQLDPIAAYLDPEQVSIYVNSFCSSAAADTVRRRLCADRRLPTDATNPRFRQADDITLKVESKLVFRMLPTFVD